MTEKDLEIQELRRDNARLREAYERVLVDLQFRTQQVEDLVGIIRSMKKEGKSNESERSDV